MIQNSSTCPIHRRTPPRGPFTAAYINKFRASPECYFYRNIFSIQKMLVDINQQEKQVRTI